MGRATRTVSAATAARRLSALGATVGRAARDGEGLADPVLLRDRARGVLGSLGIALEVSGAPLPGFGPRRPADGPGTLIVANHISWLDAVALLAAAPTPLLAKREVAEWPVLGRLARRAGTLFIDRDAVRTLPDVVADVAAVLRNGRPLALFPAATTWCTAPGGAFRRATFQAAIDAGAPVQAVTLGYRQYGEPSTVPAYVGESSFPTSLRHVARCAGLAITVRAHPPLPSAGLDRRELARLAQASMADPAPPSRPAAEVPVHV
ncbi:MULTISPECIES: lysophospholipid acyltransferase family protein [unclassified Streptomyces]|uniref:lysophospholipid acyltransferase family protein n=1 Tax=unclassified Streptomyces TaxID=2593676 RepID=UPI0022B743D7|nr:MULTISPECIES: lysophospholipid acyltransferase family protein [unclassified Streptomyces]MCZ7414784.1 lysophospholipid acyltransferase family protein [Streptomyces sp. WMMC897]MCZ7431708.1 lysophospholipid acyltransferase family protein [Streptomyces sp. WMMC1477]